VAATCRSPQFSALLFHKSLLDFVRAVWPILLRVLRGFA
jgi:hypothetical protein